MHKILLVLHAVCAGVLAGSTTHLALQARAVLRGRPNPRLVRLHPPIALAAWATTTALGFVLYPRYRVFVRAATFDVSMPGMARWFDAKEMLALFVGPLLAVCVALRSAALSRDRTRLASWFAANAVVAAALVWFALVSGLSIVSVRSV